MMLQHGFWLKNLYSKHGKKNKGNALWGMLVYYYLEMWSLQQAHVHNQATEMDRIGVYNDFPQSWIFGLLQTDCRMVYHQPLYTWRAPDNNMLRRNTNAINKIRNGVVENESRTGNSEEMDNSKQALHKNEGAV